MTDVDYNLIAPEEIPGKYQNGEIKGVIVAPHITKDILARSSTPLFGAAAYHLENTGSGRVSAPYQVILEFEPEFGRYEPQTTGDCVSHGTRNAGMVDYAVDCKLEHREYHGRFATENIYGARGHGGQGAHCGRLADYVNTYGGFLVRDRYESGTGQSVDLSRYNSRIGHNWGRPGTPSWLNKIADDHRARHIALVTTVEEARDAIANGYGINVCSGTGFSSRRDEYGVSAIRGRWAHAMAWVGVNDDKNSSMYRKYGMCFLVQNSWGVWNGGPKAYEQPDGSFWISEDSAKHLLRQRGSWTICNVEGFPMRKIDYLLI